MENPSRLDVSNPVRLDECTLLVKTSCQQCYVDVGHSKVREDFKFVSVGLLSTHVGWWSGQLRTRLAEAWRVLRGGSYPFIELYDVLEADALIEALQTARQQAFGSVESDHQVRPEQA